MSKYGTRGTRTGSKKAAAVNAAPVSGRYHGVHASRYSAQMRETVGPGLIGPT